MRTCDYIWVNVCGGVQGYAPEEVADFKAAYKAISALASPVDYWDYWNHYFNTDHNEIADGFSALWHFNEAWNRLYELRKRI